MFIACCVVICLMCVMILQRCMDYSKFDIRIYTISTIELFLRIMLLVAVFRFDFYSCLFLEFNSSIVLHVVVVVVVVVLIILLM